MKHAKAILLLLLLLLLPVKLMPYPHKASATSCGSPCCKLANCSGKAAMRLCLRYGCFISNRGLLGWLQGAMLPLGIPCLHRGQRKCEGRGCAGPTVQLPGLSCW